MLRLVKVLHTVAWAIFVTVIFAIPVAALRGEYRIGAALAAVIAAEVAVLLLNGWRCPLTDLAARYTSDRHDNFDIYLPLWLAKHNKNIFGAIYILSLAFLAARWSGAG